MPPEIRSESIVYCSFYGPKGGKGPLGDLHGVGSDLFWEVFSSHHPVDQTDTQGFVCLNDPAGEM